MTGTRRYRWTRGTLAAALLVTIAPGAAMTPTPAQPARPSLAPAAESRFQSHQRPVPGRVIRAADIPEQNWMPGHRGVDLAASVGDTVVTSAAGVVHFAGVVAGTPVVSVDHGPGLRTTYEPVLAEVRAGDEVRAGQRIGVLADTAGLPGTARRDPGLSWGARVGEDLDRYIDPMTLLAVVRVRLWE